MMKKYACKVLAAAMAVTMMVPGVNALAANSATVTNTSTASNCQTSVKYSVTESYTWQVPSDVTFTKDEVTQTKAADNGVKITQNIIKSGQKLVIKISDGQVFTINANAAGKTDATLNYAVYKGTETTNALSAGSEVLSLDAGYNTASTAMTYKLTLASGENVSEVAGEYAGTLSYTASVVSQ